MLQRLELAEQVSRDIVLSIIVPTYNERDNLPELINRVEDTFKMLPFELIIVDDNSPDGTAELAEKLNAKYGNIKVIKRHGKLGLGSAVLTGFKEANADVLAVMDADLQHPPEILPKMYDKILEGYELVVASRYIEGGGCEGWSMRRRVISKGATLLAHMLFPKVRKVKDVMSGFFMLKKKVLKRVNLDPLGYKILLEILVKGNYFSVTEIPYIFKRRRKGKSNLNIKEIWNYIGHLYKMRVHKS